eukprot:TRINITY_DN19731_c0_g1_i1.p1 TRINITY_DN19731_c0_g1~~TRINITY_DN19731_c0_g1_i1.p1  ORF type:complete len:156 (-),score=37.10 TRINITY_DN19731_c0_g1_i1:74-505(-)
MAADAECGSAARQRSRSRSPPGPSSAPGAPSVAAAAGAAEAVPPAAATAAEGAAEEEEPAWVQVTNLPPRTNWSSLRRIVNQHGGHIRGGKVYQSCNPAYAVAEFDTAEEAEKIASKLTGMDFGGKRLNAKVISAEMRSKLNG